MYTKQDLLQQLKNMKVPTDRMIHIHSSLRAVGDVEGRGQTVLDALVEHITADGGILCVPTHTWHLMFHSERPTLDLTQAETCVGTLSRLAIQDPRGIRTHNPTHSMVIFGDPSPIRARIEREATLLTHTAPEGVLGGLAEQDGFVLLIGVNHSSNTYLHCVEEMLRVPGRILDQPIPVSVKKEDGTVEHRQIKTFDDSKTGDVSKKFPKFEPAFRHHGCIVDGKLGDAPVQLCRARGMKQVLERIYSRNDGKELLGDSLPLDPSLYQ